jgi:hypothetical protein
MFMDVRVAGSIASWVLSAWMRESQARVAERRDFIHAPCCAWWERPAAAAVAQLESKKTGMYLHFNSTVASQCPHILTISTWS